MSAIYTFRSGKRLALVTVLMTCLFLYAFHQGNTRHIASSGSCHATRSLNMKHIPKWTRFLTSTTQPYYRDLNTLNATSAALQNQERILVLTPLLKADAIDHLETYFDLLDKSTYPNHLISIGLLISSNPNYPTTTAKSRDLTEALSNLVERLQGRWFNAFHDITVYQRDFHFDFDPTDEQRQHQFKLQPYRRSVMARARNYLLTAALQDDHSWVAWVDVNVIRYPPTIFEDLIRHDVDVIVPNCLLPTEDGSFWAYDRNNWQETDGSLRFQRSVGEDFVMLEGFSELATGRTLLVDMPTHLGHDHLVPLDGVGATFTLVKAQVHREGANFPSYPLQHQVETEGFARMVQAMGYGIFGIPSYFIYHANP